jgi:hypothetical protein
MKNKSILAIMLATTMGFVINGVKFALLLVAGCLDDNVLSEQITF